MLYKHIVAIQSSEYYKDSLPSEEWYEKKWLNWTPETEDLEISKNYKHFIKRAYPYGD
jgi:phosphorylcholine metabolism protein LicD